MGNQDQTGQSNNGKSEAIIDLFLPANFSGLRKTSESVYDAICKELYRDQLLEQKPELKEGTLVVGDSFTIRIRCPGSHEEQKPKEDIEPSTDAIKPKEDIEPSTDAIKPKEDIEPSTDAIAGILFSDKFTDRFARSNDDAYPVLAMMGGQLPLEKNFFRWGFASSLMGGTISRIIDDEREDQDAFVLLICGPDKDDGLATAFKNAFIGYGEHVTPDKKRIEGDKIIKVNLVIRYENETSVFIDDPNKEGESNFDSNGAAEQQEQLKAAICQALSSRQKAISAENSRINIVFHGYWENYGKVVETVSSVIQQSNYDSKRFNLYVDANYFLQVKKKDDNFSLTCPLVCITGRRDEKDGDEYQDHFVLFAREVVKLCRNAVKSITSLSSKKEQKEGENTNSNITEKRHAFRRYLKSCKFYETAFGTIFFRDDGELFMPLYRYKRENPRSEESSAEWSDPRQFKERDVLDRGSSVGVADLLAKTISHIDEFETQIDVSQDILGSLEVKRLFRNCKVSFAYVCDLKHEVMEFWKLKGDELIPCRTDQDKDKPEDFKEMAQLVQAYGKVSSKVKCRRYVQPIQINVMRKDINDNDALRCHYVTGENNKPDSWTINPIYKICGSEKVDEQKRVDEQKDSILLVLSQSQTYADTVLEKVRNEKNEKIDALKGDKECVEEFAECSVIALRQNVRNAIKKILDDVRDWPHYDYIYCIPAEGDSGGMSGCLTFPSKNKLSLLDLQILSNCVTRIFQSIDSVIHRQEMLRANTRIAIGSIMSRNGSHNIGSHVLAALSHNVGTLPDDRILYQYIQHRMDYIATATTEFPRWSQPTMLVSNIMKEFFRQAHLLDYISCSEGLRAYKFQGHARRKDQKNTLQIHVRGFNSPLKKEADVVVLPSAGNEFITYPNADMIDFSKDLAVAIPGGNIGRHAFFTILENVIRNAAKHEWSAAVKRKENTHHLELYVDFANNQEGDTVSCLVWHKIAVDKNGTGLPVVDAKLVDELNEKFQARFFDDRGHLKRENWGIAEMRISAGYLMGCDVAEVGALTNGTEAKVKKDGTQGENGCARKIIWPVWVKENDDKRYLGYRFELARPKTLLVVLDDPKPSDKKGLESPNSKCQRHGIVFKFKSDKQRANSYSYVLFESHPSDEERLSYPFRLIGPRSDRYVAGYVGEPLDQEWKKNLNELCEKDDSVDTFCFDLLENVYESWLKHLRGESVGGKRLVLDLGADGSSSGAGKSLVSDYDLCKFMFEHSFNAAARSFLSKYNGTSKEFVALLAATCADPNRETSSALQLVSYRTGKTDPKDLQELVHEMIANQHAILVNQLDKWFEEVCSEKVVSLDKEAQEIMGANWWHALGGLGSELGLKFKTCKLLELYSKEDFKEAITLFLSELKDPILRQTESFLRKYEEKICTLPKGFSETGDSGTLEWTWEGKRNAKGNAIPQIVFTCDDKVRSEAVRKHDYCYFRHGVPTDKVKCYYEPLSGSQGYLNVLMSFKKDVARLKKSEDEGEKELDKVVLNRVMRLTTGLVETAEVRVLIVDERVKKFMGDHPEVEKLLGGIRIGVMDDAADEVKNMFSSPEKLPRDDGWNMEILIVHQGIIDKFLGNQKVADWLTNIGKAYRYVVITTGRGVPANIPDSARVLPYSSIESTILQRYPEKLILIDTIMNLLPSNREV